jgi:hypothetical protein
VSQVTRVKTITRLDGRRRIGIDEQNGWFRVVEEVAQIHGGKTVWRIIYEGGFFDETSEAAQMIADEIERAWKNSNQDTTPN